MRLRWLVVGLACLWTGSAWAVEPRYKAIPSLGWSLDRVVDLTSAGSVSATDVAITGLACNGYSNGGTLTTDSAGNLVCSNDDSAASSHNLLSATHGDTVANTVSRGSLIYGNSTPAWDELTVGAANSVVRSDGTDASWTTTPTVASLTATSTVTGAVVSASGALQVGADYLNDVTGNGLAVSGGSLNAVCVTITGGAGLCDGTDADSGGATAWSAIGDAAGAGSIAFAGFDQIITSAEDGGVILDIGTSDVDQASDTTLLRLSTNDTSDANTLFLVGQVDQDGTPINDWIVSAGGTAGGLIQDWGSTGVKVTTDGDGAVTFLGQSAGADEDLNINLDDTSDKIVLSSSTSANEIQLSSLDLLVGGGNINTGNIALVVGDATTDSITLTTDSTGEGEVVAPAESIGPTEIVNKATNHTFTPKEAKLTGAYVLSTFASLDTAAESATIDGGSGPWKLLFDAATDEAAVWDWVLPDDWAAHGTLVVIFAMASATASEVEWEAAIQCVTPGDAADIDTASFADGATDGGNTVPGTAGHTDSSAITLTDDSCAAGDLIYFYVSTDANDATLDDATGDRELLAVEYNFTTTQ